MKLVVFFMCIAVIPNLSAGARILVVIPSTSPSNVFANERLLQKLGSQGHKITLIASYKPRIQIQNLRVIHLPDMKEFIEVEIAKWKGIDKEDKYLTASGASVWTIPFHGYVVSSLTAHHVFSYYEVDKLLKSKRKFDIVLGETTLCEAVIAGLSYRFQAPIVSLSTHIPNSFSNYLVGNPAPYSYIPDPLMPFGTHMPFLQRLENFVYGIMMELSYSYMTLRHQDEVMRAYISKDMPHISDIIKNTSLVLVNHHHSLAFSRPYTPNMIEVGGMHIAKPKPLPQDLRQYMDDSKKGVVYFSLGAQMNSSNLSPEKINIIVEGLGRLQQNVLWKFEVALRNLPRNVKISNWFPQADILAHPNLKTFITHGGLLSTIEALEREVPIVGIPFDNDQYINVKHAVDAGWAIGLDFNQLTADIMYDSVNFIINSTSYKENIKRKSALLKDNPISPLRKAVWWIEYVLRHNGASNLKSAAQDLSFYQLYLWDVLLFSLMSILFMSSYMFVAIWLSCYVFREILKKLHTDTTSKQSRRKKTKKRKDH